MEKQRIAQYMKSFVNPLRLQIIDVLSDGELSVNKIVDRTGAKQCYVSQQLKLLTENGILCRREQDHFVFYRLRDRSVINMLEMVRIGIMAGQETAEESFRSNAIVQYASA